MLNALFSGVLVCCLFVAGVLADKIGKKEIKPVGFLSMEHTRICKGIAIVMVVISHIGNTNDVRIFAPFGGMGVAIFLFCSGFGVSESAAKGFDFIHFWAKRIICVLLPYALTRLLCIAVYGSNAGITEQLLDIMLIKTRYPYGWYLTYLMVWYIIFSLLMFIGNRGLKTGLLIFASAGCFLLSPDKLSTEQCLSFALGCFASLYGLKNRVTRKRLLNVFVIAMLAGCVFFLIKSGVPIQNEKAVALIQLGYKVPWAAASVIAMLSLSRITSLSVFAFVGTISYELYLVHGYFLRMTSRLYLIPVFFAVITAICFLFNIFNKFIQKKLPAK